MINIIIPLDSHSHLLRSASASAQKAQALQKKQSKAKGGAESRAGMRSTGLDKDGEEALLASGTGLGPAKSLEEGGRDQLMVKLGETIQPMKDSFIVAYLNWEEPTRIRAEEVVIETKKAEKKAEKIKAQSEQKVKEEEEKAKKQSEE